MANIATLDDSVEVTQDGLDLAVAVEAEVDAATSQVDLVSRLNAVMDEADLLPEGDQMVVGAAVSVALEGWVEAFDDANWPSSSGGGEGGGTYEDCIEEAIRNGMLEEEAWNECNEDTPEVLYEESTSRRSTVFISAVNASSSAAGFCDTYVRPLLRKNAAKIFISSFLGGGAMGITGGVVGGLATGVKGKALLTLTLWVGAGTAATAGTVAIGAALGTYYYCEHIYGIH
jgi:hypothetical protein